MGPRRQWKKRMKKWMLWKAVMTSQTLRMSTRGLMRCSHTCCCVHVLTLARSDHSQIDPREVVAIKEVWCGSSARACVRACVCVHVCVGVGGWAYVRVRLCGWVGGWVRAFCVCVGACVRACVRACVHVIGAHYQGFNFIPLEGNIGCMGEAWWRWRCALD